MTECGSPSNGAGDCSNGCFCDTQVTGCVQSFANGAACMSSVQCSSATCDSVANVCCASACADQPCGQCSPDGSSCVASEFGSSCVDPNTNTLGYCDGVDMSCSALLAVGASCLDDNGDATSTVCASGTCNSLGDGNCDGTSGDQCILGGVVQSDCLDSGRCVVMLSPVPPPSPPNRKRQGDSNLCDSQCLIGVALYTSCAVPSNGAGDCSAGCHCDSAGCVQSFALGDACVDNNQVSRRDILSR
jgi:hypothetical protein